MSRIKSFNKIRLHNFKGVEDMVFDLSGNDAIILGGKNGFGKTSIFDALELVLTGKIARYSSYKDSFIDGRRTYSQEERPLVCSQNVEVVRVDVYITISLGDGREINIILTRQARTEDMNNPVDFEVFNELQIREREEDVPIIATEEMIKDLGLSEFIRYYATLNYMSQEESTRFIKSKDTKRVEEVQFLFNTGEYDRRVNKIDKVLLKALKEMKRDAESEMRETRQTIEALEQYGLNEGGDPIGYQKLFNGISVEWDLEKPFMNNEEYYSLLKEGGLLDEIIELIDREDEYRKYQKCQRIAVVRGRADDYSMFLQYRNLEQLFALWNNYLDNTVEPFRGLDLQSIETYSFSLPDELKDLIGNEFVSAVQDELRRVQSLYAVASTSQRAYNEMLSQRNNLASQLQRHASGLMLKRCPLCGYDYEDTQKLLESVEAALTIQHSTFESINANVTESLVRYKQLVSKAIAFIDVWFEEQGVNPDTNTLYGALNLAEIKKEIKWFEERNLLNGFPKEDVERTRIAFNNLLQTLSEDYDNNLDYERLTYIYDGYVRYIPKEFRTVEIVQQKRVYLLQLWNRGKSQQMSLLTEKQTIIHQRLTKYDELETKLIRVKNSIIAERDAYLKRVINDVEILFYIYSGRIMQDGFYGRGLFMKNVQSKYIYFVSNYNSDVDALYKMSSGQLVALMMALLLSLNKLYSESLFLAIDDPIQTIDDINVWGFIETIRHEFRDYQFLFSTHEFSYGSFLRYKLSNMGINAKYIDMMDMRKNVIVE